jgi:hypothetical protein
MSRGYNGDTKMGILLDDPVAKEVLLQFLPEIKTAGPMLKLARGMTLTAISAYPQAKIPPARLQAIVAALEKL